LIRVALVEDDIDLLDDTVFALRDEGLHVVACSDGRSLDLHLPHESFDVVVLDIGLPGENGLSIARRLRRTHPRLGIVMLTARTTSRDRVQGMEEGADVYLSKPADMRELALVIQALARRLGVGQESGGRSIALLVEENILLTATDERIELTPSETLILCRLARATGRQATRRQLIEAFGAAYFDYDERRLEAIISRLRRKLEAAGLPANSVTALRGIGYMLQIPIAQRINAASVLSKVRLHSRE
jgi:DNA-binding response OmpR family regulator